MVDSAGGVEGVSDEFLEIPHLVYARDPMWIPERGTGIARSFSARNPWFDRGKSRTFWIPGQARIAAFRDPLVSVDGRPAAFFGFWETLGDVDSNVRLFGEVERWARSEGAVDLYGPMNFSVFGSYRLRVTAEPKAVTFPGEPYNPAHYVGLLGRLGFTASQHYTTWIAEPEDSREQIASLASVCEDVLAAGYRLQSLSHGWWMAHLREIHECLDAILSDYFAYAPLPYALFESTFGEAFIRKACPHSSVRVEASNGALAGFLIVYPHYGPLVVAGAGAGRIAVDELDHSTHLPRLLGETDKPDYIAYFVGAHPDHRHDGSLFAAMTAMAAQESASRAGRVFGAMSRSTAPRMTESTSVASQRTYAIFRRTIEP